MSSKADFTPERGTYKDLTPFRYWCQKVLPLVYDDALSYYELLSKVLDYLNKTMEDVNTLHEDVDNLFEAYELLQTWVNDYTENYFEGEGFIQDLDAALDRMVASGEFGSIVNEKVASQINAVVASQIGGTVAGQLPGVVSNQISGTVAGQLPAVVNNQLPPVAEAWLNANINPSSNVLDSSLSIPPNDDIQAEAPAASAISSVVDGFLCETDLIELPRNYSSTHKHFSCYLDNLTSSADPNITYKTEYAQFKKNNQLILTHKANYIDVNGVVCMPTYIQLTGNLIPPPYSISGGTMTWDSFAKTPNDYNAEAINSHYINAKSFSNVELTISIDLENIENANIDLTTMKLVMLKPTYASGEYTGVVSQVLADIVFDDPQLSTHMVGHCSTTLPDLNYNGVGDYYGNNAGFAIYTGAIRTFEVDGNAIGGSSGIFGKNILATMSISFKSISNETKEIDNLKADLSELVDIVPSPNLLDVNAVTNGYLRNTGAVKVSGDWVTTDFIPIEYGKTYTYSITVNSARQTGTMYFRLEYDENKTIIANSYVETVASRITPSENAKYVRFSYHNTVTATDRCFAEGMDLSYYEYGATISVKVKEGSNSEAVLNLLSVVDVEKTKNLFDKDAVKSGYIINVNGDITASDEWFYSDYIPVEYGENYVLFNHNGKQGLYFVQETDENKTGVAYYNSSNNPYTPSTNSVKYVRFCQKTTISISTMVFMKGNQATGIFIPFGQELVTSYRNLLYGKKWVAVGDSLTEKNVSAISNYTDFISVLNNMEIVNMGVGGTGYMRGYDGNNAFYQRVANIPDCDIITIFGSGNDLAYYSDLGTATDSSTDTICGCINETLDVIFENHPTTPLLVIAPTPWAGNTPDMTTGMALYCERLKEICSRRGIAYLDLFHYSGLRPDDAVQRDLVFYNGSLDGHGDYVHPNKLGHSIIAPRIMQGMESVMIF